MGTELSPSCESSIESSIIGGISSTAEVFIQRTIRMGDLTMIKLLIGLILFGFGAYMGLFAPSDWTKTLDGPTSIWLILCIFSYTYLSLSLVFLLSYKD
jgi:hypothetical protein